MDKLKETPVYSECVIGYRSWRLNDWVLTPLSVGGPWRPGINHACCHGPFAAMMGGFWDAHVEQDGNAQRHKAPHANCVCGLYAYHEPPRNPGPIIGAIAAWGDLQVHPDGFRAEYAQIVALAEPANLHGSARDGFDLAVATYRVPVVPRELLEVEALQHGSPLPRSARPTKPPTALTEKSISTVPSYLQFSGLTQQYAQQYMISFGAAARNAAQSLADLSKAASPPRRASNRQGPPRPQRPPRKLPPPGGALR